MPPKQKMPEEVIASLTKWVEMGAPDPRIREVAMVETEIDIEAGKNHWSYRRPILPSEKSIDDIIAKKRSAQGLKPVPPADAHALLRRLTFDLTGLPPTPPEVQAFYREFEEDRKRAIVKKVDQLLESEHYGERWGRHWLDAVRYGESSGTHNIVYPYAWRFRNYVIDSFNEDKPYDRLITEHLAGDLLDASSTEERQENLIATGFLAIGPKKQNEKNRQVFRMNLIDEQIDTTTRAFLATTVACARCHDHKFDPIPTTDYYAMAGIFKSTETLWGTIAGNQNHRTSELMELPIPDSGLNPEDQGNEYEVKQQRLAELVQKNNELRGRDGKGKGKRKGKGKGAGGQDSDNRAEMLESMGLERRDLVRLKQQILRLQSELQFLNPDGSAKTFAMGAREGSVENCSVLIAGDINKPAQEVERGFLRAIDVPGTPVITEDYIGRLELADWITSTNNPLTARVMANRIWTHLTGIPIVETMDNFGSTGLPPTNQGLLDFLAIRFMENGWSIKQLIREIVLSDTYQLAATFDETSYAKDPGNTTHWRAAPRQLDAEALRDQMLLVSGLLDRVRPDGSIAHQVGDSRLGGRGPGNATDSFDTAHFRGRSIYLPILRDALPDELGLFDFPDPQGTVGRRSPTNVAPQSLHLMNSDLVYVQATSMARVLEKNFSSVRDQISNGYLLAYNRAAIDSEVERALLFLDEFAPGDPPAAMAEAPSPVYNDEDSATAGERGKGKGGKSKGKAKGGARGSRASATPPSAKFEPSPITPHQIKLTAFCQALMMSAEFRTIH